MKRCLKRVACAAILVLVSIPAVIADDDRQYVFGWPFVDDDLSPRGGTTQGPPVQVVTETSEDFIRLQADGISKFERDRRAILAMAGTYRVSFDFLEIVGYAPGFEPERPYRSWGTEHVYVIDDGGDRISLQHILIMSIVGEDGQVMGPFVTKHWRQDWVYENPEVHTYQGFSTWARQTRAAPARAGDWSQTVWQVDDSPRYAAWGNWNHTPERSWWTSDQTWRPLPRREFSVRDDYDVLIGSNTHIVLPTGWVQEEHNVKARLAGPGKVRSRVAREIGIARYERIRDFDTEPGDDYWQATAAFWAEVRDWWRRAMAEHERIALRTEVDGRKLFEPLFERAGEIAAGASFTPEANRAFVARTIEAFRTAPDASEAAEY